MQQTHQPKNPGGRRRGVRNGTPQKTYASEPELPNPRQVHSDSPSTPRNAGSGAAAASRHSQSTSQRQRSRNTNKGRNKNGTASPGNGNNQLHRRSPSNGAPAYAGATFHHSPAPGSLPIPKFLARTTSAPDSPTQRVVPSQEPSPPPTDSEEAIETIPPRHDESPLEFFFQKDRAEKARTRRASAANVDVPLGPVSPPREVPVECNTMPRVNGSAQNRLSHVARNPSMPPNGLDGSTGQPLGPSFSTPYQERIRAARSTSSSSAQATPAVSVQGATLDDPSEALKRYLFFGKMGSQQQQPELPQKTPTATDTEQRTMPRGMFPASILTSQQKSQNTPARRAPPQNTRPDQQMRLMEDNLKRMLKLDSSA